MLRSMEAERCFVEEVQALLDSFVDTVQRVEDTVFLLPSIELLRLGNPDEPPEEEDKDDDIFDRASFATGSAEPEEPDLPDLSSEPAAPPDQLSDAPPASEPAPPHDAVSVHEPLDLDPAPPPENLERVERAVAKVRSSFFF